MKDRNNKKKFVNCIGNNHKTKEENWKMIIFAFKTFYSF